jgi:hypothetical protein
MNSFFRDPQAFSIWDEPVEVVLPGELIARIGLFGGSRTGKELVSSFPSPTEAMGLSTTGTSWWVPELEEESPA